MDKKVIFLDIDGTICKYGIIQPSAITAIQKAREIGHKVLLCTGRSLGIIDTDLINVGFDGIIASAGAYVEIDGNILFHQTIDTTLLNTAIDYFEKYDIRYYLETNTNLYSTQENIDIRKNEIINQRLKRSKIQGIEIEMSNSLKIMQSVLTAANQLKNREDINKITFTSVSRKVAQIKKDWEGKLTVIPSTIKEMGDDSGEISQIGITKATGMQHAIQYMGFPREATIAVGDSHNDFQMLDYANIGIAMGNALEELKEVADYVTAPIQEDGLCLCFQKYGLLS